MNDTLTFQFSTTPAFSSWVIRKITRSQFSHVDLVLDDGSLLGASDPGGVAIRPFDYEPFLIRRRAVIRTPQANSIKRLIHSQLGKPFDHTAVQWRNFFKDTTREWRLPDRWFCAELDTWACDIGGLFGYELLTRPGGVTPQEFLLLLNPYVNAIEFHKPVIGLQLGPQEV